ncbi:flagellar biosynthetic protein FliR [Pseudomonas lijiangensis]|uniref:Flagellar biosynthetic protein FliR n=1 Tax=Pseudomonas lijiangensis TaxID=2995658 RepID=A0ABX8HUI1_9PSED|nr:MULTISPECIES: flagellar biosynthetic protein FliR [Pseudomonas syringae group]MBX8501128.1 flagellar biosynthetic protein FliR [Pseudomonas lijiangensis]MBX8505962.1 flagellar biosynthetic protein FliR [Pseudomonas lijiangensis]MBX8520650.1 flagellar biosynthetic protein FliR [Pseudomonas cichorii]MBX8554095.1 flagellar biosynthetic protein FliR [Pseudomonas cichorii]MBX8602086.1 flagellar biosynthetic protein FliR [Pseudomonas cichorii]
MIEVSSAQLQLWVTSFFWPFCRVLAFLMSDPILGHKNVSSQVKVGLAMLLSFLLAPNLAPTPDIPLFSWAGLGVIVEQMLIGMSLGMVMRITLAVVEMAGEICGMQMGLAFATFFSADTNTNSMVLSRFLSMITILMFLALDGHLMVLELLALTFKTLPIGTVRFDPNAWNLIARYGSTIFLTGLLLALPMVATLLIINLAMGILNRVSPQLTVFSVGFPATLLVGLILLMVVMGDLGQFLSRLLTSTLQFMQYLIINMALP